VTHAVVLLLVVLVAAGPVGQIPLAALAGVLMVTAVRMVHLDTVRAILRSTRADAVAFVATAVITVSFDLIVAVVIGVAFAGFFALRGMSQASQVRREDVRGQTQPGDERIAILRFDGPLSFTSADRVSAEVDAVRGVSVVIMRMSQLELVDATGRTCSARSRRRWSAAASPCSSRACSPDTRTCSARWACSPPCATTTTCSPTSLRHRTRPQPRAA
jgi:SulP family sulfate permease